MKTLILLVFATVLGFHCTPSPPLDDEVYLQKKNEFDAFFLDLRQDLQQRRTEAFTYKLSRESLQWLENMRYAATREAYTELEKRPFFEIITILALRVERRNNAFLNDSPERLIEKLLMDNQVFKKSILNNSFGNVHFRGNLAELGLAKATHVPVFFFTFENESWKFVITRSLPLILQGAENIGMQRRIKRIDQAIYILERFGGLKIKDEDLQK